MKRLFRRTLPLLVAILGGGLGYVQFRFPLSYPWPLVVLLVAFSSAVAFYAVENKKEWRQIVAQIIPTTFFLLAIGASVLLAETVFTKWLIAILLFVIPLLSLELLYLAYFESFRYPVNAISRINIAFVPAISFLFGVTGNGLHVFLRLSPLYGLIIFPTAIGVLYFLTSHPTAATLHRLRWAALGAALGMQVAILVFILPVPLPVHGAIAAILVSTPIRIRRYAYAPTPSKRHAWFEGITVFIFFLTILLISPWA